MYSRGIDIVFSRIFGRGDTFLRLGRVSSLIFVFILGSGGVLLNYGVKYVGNEDRPTLRDIHSPVAEDAAYLASRIVVKHTEVGEREMAKVVSEVLGKSITAPVRALFVGTETIFGEQLLVFVRSVGGSPSAKRASIIGSWLLPMVVAF